MSHRSLGRLLSSTSGGRGSAPLLLLILSLARLNTISFASRPNEVGALEPSDALTDLHAAEIAQLEGEKAEAEKLAKQRKEAEADGALTAEAEKLMKKADARAAKKAEAEKLAKKKAEAEAYKAARLAEAEAAIKAEKKAEAEIQLHQKEEKEAEAAKAFPGDDEDVPNKIKSEYPQEQATGLPKGSNTLLGENAHTLEPADILGADDNSSSDAADELAMFGYRWAKGKHVGNGDFSEVYEATSSKGEISQPVVLKVEKPNVLRRELDKEATILRRLQGVPGIPKFHQYVDNQGMPNHHRFLAMQKLGINLEKYRTQCGGHLSEPIVLRLATQMIDRFHHVHHHKFVYRDTKPENFMLGWNHEGQHLTNTLYLIDFGLASSYWDYTWKMHAPKLGPNGKHQNFVGTLRYAGEGALSRHQQSRKDDMETLAYVLGHLFTGALPWTGVINASDFDTDNKEKALKKELKQRKDAEAAGWTYTKDKMFEGITKHAGDAIFPDAIRQILQSVRMLGYDEKPKYDEYKNIIADSARHKGIDLNAGFIHKKHDKKHDTDAYELKC